MNPNRIILSDFRDDLTGQRFAMRGDRDLVTVEKGAKPDRKRRRKRRHHSAHKPSATQRAPALENPQRWQHVRDSESVESGGTNAGNGRAPSDYPRPNQSRETCQQPRPTGQHDSQQSPTGVLQPVIQFT